MASLKKVLTHIICAAVLGQLSQIVQSKPVTNSWTDAHTAILGVNNTARSVFDLLCKEKRVLLDENWTCEGFASNEYVLKGDALFNLPRRIEDLTISVGDGTDVDDVNKNSLTNMKHSLFRFGHALSEVYIMEKTSHCRHHHGQNDCRVPCHEPNFLCGVKQLRAEVNNAVANLKQTMYRVWRAEPVTKMTVNENAHILRSGHRLGYTFASVYVLTVEAKSFTTALADMQNAAQ